MTQPMISIAAAAPFASPFPSTPFPPYTYSLPLLLLSAAFPFFSYTHFPIYTPFLYSLSTPFLSYLLLSSAPPIPLSTHTLCISYTLPLILLYIFASLSTPFLCSSSITLSPPPPPLPLSVSFPLPSPSSYPFPLSLLPIFPKFTSSLTPVPFLLHTLPFYLNSCAFIRSFLALPSTIPSLSLSSLSHSLLFSNPLPPSIFHNNTNVIYSTPSFV